MYYNTTNSGGPTLFDSVNKTEAQEDLILNYFKKYPESMFSPCDIHNVIFHGQNVPITSTRRSISDLTSDGKLIKTDQFKIGIYGKKTYLWRLNKTTI